tara:strand:+ start:7819 stop:9561 length:1743 start_codon:yes stop_codon:yes gene_type:complete
MIKSKTLPLIRKLFYSLDTKRKVQFCTLIVLNIISSCLEAIAISASYPFLSLLQSSASINNSSKVIGFIFKTIGIDYQFKPIIIFFMGSILISSFLKFIVLAFNAIYANTLAYDFSLASFGSSLDQNYRFFLSNPISSLVNRNIKGIEGTLTVIYALLQIITSTFLILITVSFLIFLNPKLTIGIFIFITFVYILIFGFFKNFMTRASNIIYKNNAFKIKTVQEAYRYYKNIILDKTGFIFFKSFKDNEYQLRRIQALQQIIIQCPKIIIENSILILLGLTALIIVPSNNSNFEFLALLGTYALGFQRLLPIAQSMYLAFSDIKKFGADLKDVLKLSIKKDDSKIMSVNNNDQIEIENISINQVSFSHSRSKEDLIKNIQFTLKSGDYLGINGKSGTGKSTLLDIILGFLTPSKGNVLVNGINIHLPESKKYLLKWQNSISYVPQSPLILNDTIKKNLSINGNKKYMTSDKEIYEILEIVQLKEFIQALPYGIDTILGDDGNTISGGQKQRIAIARALLKNAKVLVLDESTSGLDSQTERNLLKNIISRFPNLIIIFVSHNPNVFEFANVLINLDKLKVV